MKLIFQIFIIVIILAFAPPGEAHQRKGCKSKDHVFCQILERSPRINKEYARKLSFEIRKFAKKYKVPARILTAILGAESSFRLSVVREECGYQKNKWGVYRRSCIAKDFGIAQISLQTANRYGFDVNLLTSDLSYSIEAGAEVLKWFKDTYAKKEQKWFLRYNCGVAKNINRKTCRKYNNAIKKWW